MRYSVDGVKGQVWTERIKEYQTIKTEYERLRGLWRKEYIGNPNLDAYLPEINADSLLSTSFWNSAEQEANQMARAWNIKFKGQHFRSKNELAACQMIDRMGYEFKTEVVIRRTVVDTATGASREVLLYPDVLFYIPELNRAIALELDGAMEQDRYRLKAEYRKKDYIDSGFVEGKDVLFYRMTASHDLNIDALEAMVSAAVEANIPKTR